MYITDSGKNNSTRDKAKKNKMKSNFQLEESKDLKNLYVLFPNNIRSANALK